MNEGKIFGYGKAKDWQTKKQQQTKELKQTNLLGDYLKIDWVM